MSEKITVCACTYQRPQGLTDLIASLRLLSIPPNTTVEYCVIDNDTSPSAKSLVEASASDFPAPLRYVHETQPGIPYARNRALQVAGTDGFIVFVDDDETVDSLWLVELYRVATETGATFVQGPVKMLVEESSDQWWLDTALFRQRTFADLSPRHESWTNNVMINMGFIHRTACQFEETLRFDGGSDTLFFRDVVRNGGTGSYAANAIVFEIQPKSRLTWRWAIQRQYRYGITRANTKILRESKFRALVYCLIRGTGMFAWGTGCLLTTPLRGRKAVADSAAYLARGTGVFLGGTGVRKLEYERHETS